MNKSENDFTLGKTPGKKSIQAVFPFVENSRKCKLIYGYKVPHWFPVWWDYESQGVALGNLSR